MSNTIAIDNCNICGGKRELRKVEPRAEGARSVLMGMCGTCDRRRCGWDTEKREHVGWKARTPTTCTATITDPYAKTCPNGHHI